ncbi:class I adenylate-forming enzyme family protein [Mycolicibacterium aubagnense]|uniref:AMP-dependent ligase n=1 Tax=Mycolicibacterium aubagnense TaxID=319707 RepID=A0ABN5YQI4_9MYCO|nr:AMP-binding protein [Mycolicibacterium aubagnense]TLH57680.1 AMP-dependent synthetase [Mycolicibacterium aubagnense]WGI34130.1 AMP-binding protein [Mycolicibacterium aubagnense]BBX84066.1 AMP-dependent ligase [Mycolicibacterium aubagnense]
MKLSTLTDRRAEHDPHGPAVSDARHTLTNAQLHDCVIAAANQLRDKGIGAGDVVAVQLRNRVEFVVLLFAAWRLGAAITPVNPSLTDDEVNRQLIDSATRLLVTDDDITTNTEVPTLAVAELATATVGADQTPHEDVSALALLIYTSGTTGTPKGVMLDHANLDAMAQMGREALFIGPTDRCLLILPLFHVNGIVVSVLTPLMAGASVIIADRFAPHAFFAVIERERPTYFSAVPTIYTMLAALPDNVIPDTSSVRFAICGAAPAPAELLSRFESRCGFPLIEGYGLSEGTCASTINPIDGPRRAGTVGKPFPGQRIRIVDASGDDVPTGADGEVIIAGPNVMRGYLGRPEATAATVIDGWLHTGDIGHLDSDGYLTLAGRSKDMIIRGGENIYPREIEDVLSSDPNVLEAAVIGAPDEKWGEVVVAYVAPHPRATIDPNALQARCARSLAGYKRPTEILVLGSIPKNPVGKIDKAPLRALHSAPNNHRIEKATP